jgi:hypothetical protein
MTTGSTVNAAIVENTTPPNMTVANRPRGPELAPINASGKTPQLHTVQRRRQREISLELLYSMHFEYCRTTCGPLQFQRQPAKPARQPAQKQDQTLLPCPVQRACAPNEKGEHASTKSQKHNAYDEGHALPHDELERSHNTYPHRYSASFGMISFVCE